MSRRPNVSRTLWYDDGIAQPLCMILSVCVQAADLERFFNLEPAGVKGLFKEAVASLQELVKQDERDRSAPASSSGLSVAACVC